MRRNKLSSNLTFEDFKTLASREPNLKGRWIYMLTRKILNTEDMKHPYPRFELSHEETLYFRSLADAEKHMRSHTSRVYCNWVDQVPFGDKGTYGYSNRGAAWLYDSEGNLLDYTITRGFGTPHDTTFFGRPVHRQRFKVGDIVEVVDAKYVRLAVLKYAVPSIRSCWQNYNRRKKSKFPYYMDFSDDSAVVIDGPTYYLHDHVSSIQLLKPRYPIPDDIKADMLTWNERCEKEMETIWLKEISQHQDSVNEEKGESFGEFYELRLYIHFDEDGNRPHLHVNDRYGLKVGLSIEKAEYYDHDGYTGRLTDNQLKSLYFYLTIPDQGKTRWWYMLRDWNEDNDNPERILPLDTPIPDILSLVRKQ